MRPLFLLLSTIAILLIAACGGGGNSGPLPSHNNAPVNGTSSGASYTVTVMPSPINITAGPVRYDCSGEGPVALLNDERVVYGTTCTSNGVGYNYTFIYDVKAKTYTELPQHMQFPQRANQLGDVVGFFYQFGWTGERYIGATCASTDLQPTSMLFDINDLGTSVGWVDPGRYRDCRSNPLTCTNHRAVFIALDGSQTFIYPSAPFSEAYSINDNGTALGVVLDPATRQVHSVIFQPSGALTDLTAMIATNERGGAPRFAGGYKINNLGHAIVTEGYTPSSGRQTISIFVTYFYNGATMQKIPPLAGDQSTFMTDINNHDVAVGYSCKNISETTADCQSVIYRNGVTTALASLLPAPYNTALPSGNQLNVLYGPRTSINDSGQILVNAALGFGSLALLLLTPS